MKRRVLVLTGYYFPSVKAGGPIRSIYNLIETLGDNIDFYVLTSDRDLGDNEPFENIITDKWVKVGKASVFYTNRSNLNWQKLRSIINSVDCDILYLNSFFSFKFSILPIILKKVRAIDKQIILAPRGEFNKSALGLKSTKKQLYIFLSKMINLYKKVKWHATNEVEEKSIKNIFGRDVNITVIKNLANQRNTTYSKKVIKKPGELKIVYISRIHPMKNLKQALEVIKNLKGAVKFNIYGPIEDEQYWKKCLKLINNMPNNVSVKYKGIIDNENVLEVHKKNHVFVLLTLGENFGHAIFEALIAGNPIVISDRTPWRNLESKKVGWDLPLDNNELIFSKLENLIKLNDEEYKILSKNAFNYAKMFAEQKSERKLYLNLFK